MQYKLIEEYFKEESFIGGWYLPEKFCDEIIEYYKFNEKYSCPSYQNDPKVGLTEDEKESFDLIVGRGNKDNIWRTYRDFLEVCLKKYKIKFDSSNKVNYYDIVEDYNIQRYPVGGGFKKWHCENQGDDYNIRRHLVFMTYLNNVEDGGTEFKYQKIITQAKKGLTLIWPAPWTHTHRGQISNTKEKYIVTGWYSFLNNENQGEKND